MTTRILTRRASPFVPSDTASSHGNYDTSARADAGATLMRNMTSPVGSMSNSWDDDRSDAPMPHLEVTDRPD